MRESYSHSKHVKDTYNFLETILPEVIDDHVLADHWKSDDLRRSEGRRSYQCTCLNIGNHTMKDALEMTELEVNGEDMNMQNIVCAPWGRKNLDRGSFRICNRPPYVQCIH